jgi:transcriptional regulator with XRE-family HTH domain
VAVLLAGGRVPDEPDLATRVRQRLEFLRQTRRRPDGRRYALKELADIAGTSRQWLSAWRTTGMPGMEHADRLRRHFGLSAGFFTATAPEALNSALQQVLHDLETQQPHQTPPVRPTATDTTALEDRLRDAGVLQLAQRAAEMDPNQRETLLEFAEFILKKDRMRD